MGDNNITIQGQTNVSSPGGAVLIGSTSIFTVKGGKITGCSYNQSGGVSAYQGTFIMEAGEISGNSLSGFGGGVCIRNNSGASFAYTYGTISGNTATGNGQEVYKDTEGTVTFTSSPKTETSGTNNTSTMAYWDTW